MKLLTENILTDNGNFTGCRAYSEYQGFFEHTRENGEIMLIKITFSNNINGGDLNIYLFIKERGFVKIADFNAIEGLIPLTRHKCRGDEFVEGMQYNIKLISDWVEIVFH